jgi:L-aspartate oxidase
MLEAGADHVWLDATGLDRFAERFPTIARELAKVGLDPGRDWLPVAPAAHYQCGGIIADLDGASSLPGLWVAGEASCNGVHGANRLASNSLLDGMVFGPRVVEAVERGKDGPDATGAMRAVLGGSGPGSGPGEIGGRHVDVGPVPSEVKPPPATVAEARAVLQRVMSLDAGVLRSAASLDRAAAAVAEAAAVTAALSDGNGAPTPAACELANLVEVGRALCAAATARTESRGAHTRTDFPETSPDQRVRYVI